MTPPPDPTQAAGAPAAARPRSGWERLRFYARRYGRWFLLAVGLGAAVWLVHSVGPASVWQSIVDAGPYLPVIFALDFLWVAIEGLALLVLLGKAARQIPVRAWIEALLVHYTTMVVLPVGRAGAEVARATLLSRHVGSSRAAAAGALMQSFTLLGNAAMSGACLAFVIAATTRTELSALLFANVLATMTLGSGLYLVMRQAKIGGVLGRRFKKMAHWGPELDVHFVEGRPRHMLAGLLCFVGRSVQTLQYGVIFFAVAGTFTVASTFVAQGIHLVGAGVGDMVPNQVGVTEGAYRLFAGALGLAAQPEKAVAIALLARVSNLTVAGLCAIGVQMLPRHGDASEVLARASHGEIPTPPGIGDEPAGS